VVPRTIFRVGRRPRLKRALRPILLVVLPAAAPATVPAAGTQPLSIGGTSVWGEWFQGRIDEVRVPNCVLSAADLRGDMARAVSGGA
jgi:hypothetical protein